MTRLMYQVNAGKRTPLGENTFKTEHVAVVLNKLIASNKQVIQRLLSLLKITARIMIGDRMNVIPHTFASANSSPVRLAPSMLTIGFISKKSAMTHIAAIVIFKRHLSITCSEDVYFLRDTFIFLFALLSGMSCLSFPAFSVCCD